VSGVRDDMTTLTMFPHHVSFYPHLLQRSSTHSVSSHTQQLVYKSKCKQYKIGKYSLLSVYVFLSGPIVLY